MQRSIEPGRVIPRHRGPAGLFVAAVLSAGLGWIVLGIAVGSALGRACGGDLGPCLRSSTTDPNLALFAFLLIGVAVFATLVAVYWRVWQARRRMRDVVVLTVVIGVLALVYLVAR